MSDLEAKGFFSIEAQSAALAMSSREAKDFLFIEAQVRHARDGLDRSTVRAANG